MHSRATIAALFAILVNSTVFAGGAAAMLTAPNEGGVVAAYLLPAIMAITLFTSPILGWLIAPSLNGRKSPQVRR